MGRWHEEMWLRKVRLLGSGVRVRAPSSQGRQAARGWSGSSDAAAVRRRPTWGREGAMRLECFTLLRPRTATPCGPWLARGLGCRESGCWSR